MGHFTQFSTHWNSPVLDIFYNLAANGHGFLLIIQLLLIS